MRVVATYNLKGGVGKTSTAVNLAYLAARDGWRTLLWDLDPQGAATYCFRIRPRIAGSGKQLVRGKLALDELIKGTDFEGLDLLPADFSYRKLDIALDAEKKPTRRLARLLATLDDDFDLVMLDCAPSISRLSESVFTAADLLLVPTVPTPLSLRALAQLRRHLRKKGNAVRVLPFFCMVDRRKSLHRQICDDRDDTPYPMLATEIPYSAHIERITETRTPLPVLAPRATATRAYRSLWSEVAKRMVP